MKLKILSLIALFILAACSSDHVYESGEPALQEIQLHTGIGTITPQSRGSGIITNTLTADLPVSFVRTDSLEGSYPADYAGIDSLDAVISSTGNKVKFMAGPQHYLADGKSSKLISWYPQATSITLTETNKVVWDAATGTVNFPAIDGSTDILASAIIKGAKSSLINSITYEHVLTQITVYVSVENATDVSVWGTINSIALVDKAQPCVLTLPVPGTAAGTKATATFPATNTDLPLVKMDNSGAVSGITLNTTETAIGYAMFAPHQGPGDELVLSINTATGGAKEVTILYADMELEAGTSYNVKLLFKANSINPTATINSWRTAAAGEEPGTVTVD